MKPKLLLEIRDELDREAWWENYFSQQYNVHYLEGLKEGVKLRRDYPKSERMYYISLINKQIGLILGKV